MTFQKPNCEKNIFVVYISFSITNNSQNSNFLLIWMLQNDKHTFCFVKCFSTIPKVQKGIAYLGRLKIVTKQHKTNIDLNI